MDGFVVKTGEFVDFERIIKHSVCEAGSGIQEFSILEFILKKPLKKHFNMFSTLKVYSKDGMSFKEYTVYVTDDMTRLIQA